ncbi:MAG: hypothetical protein PHN84_01835 [Desulfuromonadaceae bacterium]|nr:hypothetical protein [Desulfuromonadaceae bacterium]MDD2856793.1 hypothetical protein [Desulfuromonadaceae bacterium]
MRMNTICFCLIISAASSVSAADIVTYFRDGTLIRKEAVAVKGGVTLQLTGKPIENTLKVIPAPGTTIIRVETDASESAKSIEKQLDEMTERRLSLLDRLEALDRRESIFTAAAKSQSGKLPRKTKSNPDPIQSIRQGTEYAITQLEAVYTARRRTNQEIKRIDLKVADLRKKSGENKPILHISLLPERGRVTIQYATDVKGWQPGYSLEARDNGTAQLKLYPLLSETYRGYQTRVSIGTLADSENGEIININKGKPPLKTYNLPISNESSSDGIFNRFSGTITNNTPHYIPPGEATLLYKGAYIGKVIFEGISSGRNRVVSYGK